MPLIRNWAGIEALKPGLSPAEQQLIDACKRGEPCKLGDGELPPEGEPAPEREIRAKILRYLILGGCEDCKVEGWGVNLAGACITGVLDLSFQTAKGLTGLSNCRFQSGLLALQTRFEFLNLTRSAFPSLNAQGAEISGNVFLRGTEAKGEVSFASAQIGGQLSCEGATFENENGDALNAEGAEIRGHVSLDGTTAKGEVHFLGAQIGGQLSCNGAIFENENGHALNAQGAEVREGVFLRGTKAKGEVSFSSAQIGGELSCEGATFENADGHALNAQGLSVADGLVWWEVTVKAGRVVLTSAHVKDLVDDFKGWPKSGQLFMDGFIYDKIIGSDLSTKERIDWVTAGAVSSDEFRPQPFTQLAKFYRETGHDASARDVLFERERLVRKYARRDRMRARLSLFNNPIVELFRWLFGDLLVRWVVGYGHGPFRSLFWLIGLFVLAVIPAHYAWEEGSFAPNSGPVLVSEDWKTFAHLPDERNPAELWSIHGHPGQDWETFNRYAYAADLVIPIIDFGQTDAWTPSTTRGPWGWHLWWARWLFTAMGWLITALGAAAITGLLKRE